MLNINLAKKAKISPYVFAGIEKYGSESIRAYGMKLLDVDNKRDFMLNNKRMATARKLATHFNLPFTQQTKAGVIKLVCNMCELVYGTDYLVKARHKAAVDGRTYIAWILNTFFKFTFVEIGNFLCKDHSTIIYLCQKFHSLSEIPSYPEYKLANALKKALL